MTTLVACLTTGKGTWAHVYKLIEAEPWEKIILVTNQFGKEKFSSSRPVELVVIDPMNGIADLVEELRQALQNKILGTEVALNITSGSGKEHMALLSALLKLGLGIRIVAMTVEGMKEV